LDRLGSLVMRGHLTAICLALGLLAAATTDVSAQYGPGGKIDPTRDCQTIRQCRFERGGSYRGCISTYTCRVCKFVPSKCEIGGRSQNCNELRCTWGG
jgi:hypothetical protein